MNLMYHEELIFYPMLILINESEFELKCLTGDKYFYPRYSTETKLVNGRLTFNLIISSIYENFESYKDIYKEDEIPEDEMNKDFDEFNQFRYEFLNSISSFFRCVTVDQMYPDTDIKEVKQFYDPKEGRLTISLVLKDGISDIEIYTEIN